MNTRILLYHALDSPAEPLATDTAAERSVVVTADMFARQLQCLSRLGKQVVSLDEVLSPRRVGNNGGGQVALTFDDGHRSNWTLALPALLEAGAVAVFYVVAGFVDDHPDYLTSAQLREMATHGMSIGSHGMTHRWLSQVTVEELHRELADSRARLEDIVQGPVVDLALPGGHANRTVFEAARQCGYRSVATCKVGVHRAGGDPFRLPRLEIRRGLSIKGFQRTFDKDKLLQLQALDLAKTCLKRTCGLSRYGKLRALAHQCVRLNR